MQEQPEDNQTVIDKANEMVSNLTVGLEFIEACFRALHYQKLGSLLFSLAYSYSDDQNFNTVEQITAELKRCVAHQVNEGIEISIPAEIKVSQKVIVDGQELEIFYYGEMNLYHTAGWVYYCWYQSTPQVRIDLGNETNGETILALFNNFQEAITDQINKSK